MKNIKHKCNFGSSVSNRLEGGESGSEESVGRPWSRSEGMTLAGRSWYRSEEQLRGDRRHQVSKAHDAHRSTASAFRCKRRAQPDCVSSQFPSLAITKSPLESPRCP